MDWLTHTGAFAGAAALVALVIWALIEKRGNRVWAPRKDVEDMKTKHTALARRVDDYGGEMADMRSKNELQDQELEHHTELVAASIVEPLRGISARLEEMQRAQSKMAATQATHTSDMRALGRGLDEVKDRLNRERR